MKMEMPVIESKNEMPEQKSEYNFKFEIINDTEQRRLLMEKVESLVDQIKAEQITNVVFLDKSARPISVLCRDLWHKKYPDDDFPKTNFINIGREITERLEKKYGKKSWEDLRFSNKGKIEKHKKWIEDMSADKITEAIGEEEKQRIQDEYHHLAEAPSGTKVLLVEEIAISGESMIIAQKVLKDIFPSLVFEPFTLAENTLGNKLFFKEALFDYFNPPWRKQKNELQYGITGVVDDQEKPLTAKPTRKQPLQERLDAVGAEIATKYKEIQDVWMEKGHQSLERIAEKLETIKNFTIKNQGKDRRAAHLATNIAQEYFQQSIYPLAQKAEPLVAQLRAIDAIVDNNYPKVIGILRQLQVIERKFGKVEGEINRYETQRWSNGRVDIGLVDTLIEDHHIPDAMAAKIRPILEKNFEKMQDIFPHSVGAGWFDLLDAGTGDVLSYQRNIDNLRQLQERMQSMDYDALVKKFREELHQVVEEYWRKDKQESIPKPLLEARTDA
jgi:hypoxanthine phosphoribosyltransferase